MIDLLLFCILSILVSFLMVGTMIGLGGILFLVGQLVHYFKDMYHERRANRG